MATPDIIDVATINGVLIAGAVTTSAVDVIDVTAEHTFKLNSVIISNVDGVNDATISASVSVDNGSNYYHVAKTVTVPADSSVSLITKDTSIYLDETDLFRLQGSANNMLEYVISYETLNDA
tara:strand:+ start:177 stop:542 length:366 start_codon:yes stop_codon:yes gene_type:complete